MTSTATRVRDQLVSAGLTPFEAERKAQLLQATRAALGPGPRAVRDYFVPGRIEVLGKHTDYAGGRSLLCAVERGFIFSAAARADECVVVTDVVAGVDEEFQLSREQPTCSHWRNYPAAVVRRIARNFGGPLRGVDVAFGSDLPRAAGLSSSTALVIGLFVAIADRNGLDDHPDYLANIHRIEDLAGYLGAVENGRSFGTLGGDTGVGTIGGSQDHTAILCARPAHVVGYRFAPVAREREVAVPAGYGFVVASSGVAASKAGAVRERYNRAAEMVAAMLERCREATGVEAPTLGALHERDPFALARLRVLIDHDPPAGFESRVLLARLDQFVQEAFTIVPKAVAALEAGELSQFGALVAESQAGAEHGLGNQVAETMALARSARALGAVAASAFGAGFGGSVWALVADGEVHRFMDAWHAEYTRQFPQHAPRAELFHTRAGPALLRL